MRLENAISKCHVRSAVYRIGDPTKIFTEDDLNKMHPALRELNKSRVGTIVPKRYYKNHTESIESRVPEEDKDYMDWEEYDPRDDDDCSLYMYND